MNGVASDNPNYLSIADFIGLIANFPLTSAVKNQSCTNSHLAMCTMMH